MDYIKLFLLSMSPVAGLKTVSDTIALQRQQNYVGSAFCVTCLGGLGGAFFKWSLPASRRKF
jgi:hypothetical protein